MREGFFQVSGNALRAARVAASAGVLSRVVCACVGAPPLARARARACSARGFYTRVVDVYFRNTPQRGGVGISGAGAGRRVTTSGRFGIPLNFDRAWLRRVLRDDRELKGTRVRGSSGEVSIVRIGDWKREYTGAGFDGVDARGESVRGRAHEFARGLLESQAVCAPLRRAPTDGHASQSLEILSRRRARFPKKKIKKKESRFPQACACWTGRR